MKPIKTIEPPWVCLKCAASRGAHMPEGHVYTAHIDTCGLCGQETTVTEPSDFGRMRDLLRTPTNPKPYAKTTSK